MLVDLTGQSVLVTGASRGIGAAIARRLASSGARVAVHFARDGDAAAAVAAEIGNDARVFGADFADPRTYAVLWKQVLDQFGRIDAIVNNAGIAIESDMEKPIDAWVHDWQTTMNVNLISAAALSRFAVAHFAEHGGGRFVNVASRAAFRGDQPDYLAYAASKAGVVALTRSIARGYGKAGIKAFAIAPGFTRTDMARDFIEKYGEDYASSDIALSSLTEPDDIAPAVAFFLSGLADHATGTTLDLNAGSYVR